jgi:Fe2+ or Zn2+ uptake regulation protein
MPRKLDWDELVRRCVAAALNKGLLRLSAVWIVSTLDISFNSAYRVLQMLSDLGLIDRGFQLNVDAAKKFLEGM